MATSSSTRTRRFDAWGFEDESYPGPAALLEWLEERLGKPSPFARAEPAAIRVSPARELPEFPIDASRDSRDRPRARGRPGAH